MYMEANGLKTSSKKIPILVDGEQTPKFVVKMC